MCCVCSDRLMSLRDCQGVHGVSNNTSRAKVAMSADAPERPGVALYFRVVA